MRGGSVLDPISEGLFSALGWSAADSGSLVMVVINSGLRCIHVENLAGGLSHFTM